MRLPRYFLSVLLVALFCAGCPDDEADDTGGTSDAATQIDLVSDPQDEVTVDLATDDPQPDGGEGDTTVEDTGTDTPVEDQATEDTGLTDEGSDTAEDGDGGTEDTGPICDTSCEDGTFCGEDGCEACITEGETGAVVPTSPDCCPGLVSVSCDAPTYGGQCEGCDGAFLCTNCGDDNCGTGENFCNCPDDCPVPDCTAEGDSHGVYPGAPSCCPGLNGIGCGGPDDDGLCLLECTGGTICSFCPNGRCGPGENICNCPQDCPEDPTCTAEGDSHAIHPDAPPCCDGMVGGGCDGPNEVGVCSEGCVGSTVCILCPNGLCGPGENTCNCPGDCTD